MFVKSKFLLIAALVIAATIVSASAQASNTYVAGTTGSDANACTISQPCATVTRGVDAVDPGGKVLIIENGDYNQFTILKPVTVAAADGIHATIKASAGFAVFNNLLQPGDVISLRNLHLVALGPDLSGISNFLGQTLFIEKCTFYGFKTGVITIGNGRTYISNSTFQKNIMGTLALGPPPAEEGIARVTIDSSVFEANDNGVVAYNRVLMNVRNSLITGNTVNGMWLRANFAPTFTEVIVDNCQINHNQVGILTNGVVGGVAAINLSRSTLTRNRQAGILLQGTGYAYTFGNNTFFGNNPDITGGNLQVMQSK